MFTKAELTKLRIASRKAKQFVRATNKLCLLAKEKESKELNFKISKELWYIHNSMQTYNRQVSKIHKILIEHLGDMGESTITPIHLNYDPDHDVLRLYFKSSDIPRALDTEEPFPGIYMEMDTHNNIVSMTILDYNNRTLEYLYEFIPSIDWEEIEY